MQGPDGVDGGGGGKLMYSWLVCIISEDIRLQDSRLILSLSLNPCDSMIVEGLGDHYGCTPLACNRLR